MYGQGIAHCALQLSASPEITIEQTSAPAVVTDFGVWGYERPNLC